MSLTAETRSRTGTNDSRPLTILDIIEQHAPRDQRVNWSSTRNRYSMACPLPGHEGDAVHQDGSGSFSVNAEATLYFCFGCEESGNARKLERILGGESPTSQSVRPLRIRQRPKKQHPKEPEPFQTVTVAQLAEAKGLSVGYLQGRGWEDSTYYDPAVKAEVPAIKIPYYDQNGENPQYRYRVALDSGDRFRWEKGSKPRLFGLDLMEYFKSTHGGHLLLVEGETDQATVESHGYPVLGIPGAANFRPEWANDLQDFTDVVLWAEFDTGGSTLLAKLVNIFPHLRVIYAPPNAKDLTELAAVAGEDFPVVLEQLWRDAVKAVPSVEDIPIQTKFNTGGEGVFLQKAGFTQAEAHDGRQTILNYEEHSENKNLAKKLWNMRNCDLAYRKYKCQNLGEVFYKKFRCGEAACPHCAQWLTEQFFEDKKEILKGGMTDPTVLQIVLFSQRLHHDPVAMQNDLIELYAQARRIVTRLSDSLGKDHAFASDFCYGIRTIFWGDAVTFVLVMLVDRTDNWGEAIELLKTHFEKQTGLKCPVKETRCHGLQHAITTFSRLMTMRIDFTRAYDPGLVYWAWRAAIKRTKMIQGKGRFYRVSGSKPKKKTAMEVALKRDCPVCGDCKPIEIPGFFPVDSTPVRKVTSEFTGKSYLEPLSEDDHCSE